jgi:hypothetical protein
MALINPDESKRTKLDAATLERERGTPSSPLLLLIELCTVVGWFVWPVDSALFRLLATKLATAFYFLGGGFFSRLKKKIDAIFTRT